MAMQLAGGPNKVLLQLVIELVIVVAIYSPVDTVLWDKPGKYTDSPSPPIVLLTLLTLV